MKKNKNFLKMTTAILVLGLVCFIIHNQFSNNNQENNDKNESNATETFEGKFVKVNDFTFSLDITNQKQGDEVTYKLNEQYKVKLIFTGDKRDSFNVYINDTYVLNDFTMEENIKLYTLADSLIYVNSGYTDIRSESLYVVNDKTVTKIYELDSIKGMVPDEIKINKDSIIINGTRLAHGPSIVYDKADVMDAMLDDNSTWKEYGITENTIVEATYTYNITNNKLNLTPTITNEKVLKNYSEN